MKIRLILAAVAVFAAVGVATAKQISVVSEDGSTSLYANLGDAINGADPGSVIYLPGGGFPIANEVKINKRLTIIGNGYRYDESKVDGTTIIVGNLYFNPGSDNSAVLGCYINNDIYIGNDGPVNHITLKYCNMNSVQVKNAACLGVTINQNYIRGGSDFSKSPSIFTHNICPGISDLDGGRIEYCIFTSYCSYYSYKGALLYCDNDIVRNNIFISKEFAKDNNGYDNVITGSMSNGIDWGENPINIGEVDWNDVFVNYNDAAITPSSNFHFTQEYQQYSAYGIYGGSDPFEDNPPVLVPHVVTKQVDEHTDVSGNLNIKIVVQTGE